MTTRLRCGSRWQLGARLTSGPDGMPPHWLAMLACKQRRHPFASPATQVPALPFCRSGIDRDDHRCSIGFAPKPALPGSLPASLGATRADRGLARSIDDIAKRSRSASLTPCRSSIAAQGCLALHARSGSCRRLTRQGPGQEGPVPSLAQPPSPASCQPSQPHANPTPMPTQGPLQCQPRCVRAKCASSGGGALRWVTGVRHGIGAHRAP